MRDGCISVRSLSAYSSVEQQEGERSGDDGQTSFFGPIFTMVVLLKIALLVTSDLIGRERRLKVLYQALNAVLGPSQEYEL